MRVSIAGFISFRIVVEKAVMDVNAVAARASFVGWKDWGFCFFMVYLGVVSLYYFCPAGLDVVVGYICLDMVYWSI